MARLNRNGVEIHYEVHGSGPTVLLSHGYSATCRMWDGQIKAFQDRYQLIVWDMRGHGQSDVPSDPAAYSEEATVGDMHAILQACGASQAVVGGLSLGGYMSLAFHLRHKQMVRALMLFDTGPGFRKDDARETWNARARARGDDLDAQGFAALGPSDEVRMSQHRSAAGLAHAARGMLTQRDDFRAAVAGNDPRADAGPGGCQRYQLPGRNGLHGCEDPGRHEGGDPGRRACIQSASARGVQSRDGRVPGQGGRGTLNPVFPVVRICASHRDARRRGTCADMAMAGTAAIGFTPAAAGDPHMHIDGTDRAELHKAIGAR